MASLEALGIENWIRHEVIDCRRTHQEISRILQVQYPGARGLSATSVKRFCLNHGIHKTDRPSDVLLNQAVHTNILRVGQQYGRKTMTGLLSSQGIRAAQSRVGRSLAIVHPTYHSHRVSASNVVRNPVPYRLDYFGEKIHIDQNEKCVMFGLTHVCAIDGYSGKVVGFTSMPIKNPIVIYEKMFRPILIDYGLWDQVRVDHGREWSIVLLVQSHLSGYRHNIVRPPYLQTSSKLNHMVERFWVEVNRRVNYPIKKVAVEMVDDGDIVLSDPVHKFAISWIMLRVSDVGIKLLIEAWNNHPIPGRRSGKPPGIPNQHVYIDNRVRQLNPALLWTGTQAADQSGGRVTVESKFGSDPLDGHQALIELRERSFKERHPDMSIIFHSVANNSSAIFIEAYRYFLQLNTRLSSSIGDSLS